MKIPEFAKHVGVSRPAVHNGIKRGRLDKSVRRNARGKITGIDPVLGVREWEENRGGLSSAGADTAGRGTLREATAEYQRWRGKLAQLEYERKAGELVEADAVAAGVGQAFASCRARILRIPGDFARRCPQLASADVAVIDALVREALEVLKWNGEDTNGDEE